MDQQFNLGLAGADGEVHRNLLPHHGEAYYHGEIFPPAECERLLDTLLNDIPWRHDEVVMFGKTITTARRVAWYGESDYTYAGRKHIALEWSSTLHALKKRIEQASGARYNSCLLNLYDDGSQGMGWHQDNEHCLGPEPNIASVSFGAERRFDFRHKGSGEKVSVQLEHGSLLIMKGATQDHWHHQIPKTKKVSAPRVNLTFRLMREG